MTSFVDNSLIPGETVEARAVISWWSQIWYLILAAVSMIAVILIPLAILFVTISIVNIITTELAITNKKIIGKAGFIRRTSIDLPTGNLESINIHQSIMGRLLRYGTVSVRGMGGNVVRIPFIKRPMDFRRVVMGLMDKERELRKDRISG